MRSSRATLPPRRCPKWKSAPTTTSRGVELTDEDLLDELLRGLVAALRVEAEHADRVDEAGGLEQLELLLERREQLRCRLGSHDLRRMTVEGDHRGLEVARPREVVHEPEHLAVAEVDAVERADRDDAPARRRRRRSRGRPSRG